MTNVRSYGIMPSMANRTSAIHIRVSPSVKQAIEQAAKDNHFKKANGDANLTAYILWVMSQNDEGVAKARLNER